MAIGAVLDARSETIDFVVEECARVIFDGGTIIFPNEFQKDNFLKAGKKLVLGDATAPFEFVLGDAGTEQVVAVCNATSTTTRGLEADFKSGGFTDLGDYVSTSARQASDEVRARQITVQASGAKPEAKKPSGNVIGRAAIKIEVH